MKVTKYFLIALLFSCLVAVHPCMGQAPAPAPAATPDPDVTREIVAQSTFLSYKTVKDNFGKKFAESYFVIQVDIRNEKLNKQFIVQTLDVLIDPNQCRNGQFLYEPFNRTVCEDTFNKYFIFPSAQQSVRREELIGVGKADQDRSGRNVAFRILGFTASMGTILTGFKGLIGRDGVQGINVLGTTFTEAAKLLFPDRTGEKLENLRNAAPTEDVVIKSKESKTFNVFIPTERVFYSESWKKYKKSAGDSDKDTYTLKVVLDLLLLSSATGVLVDNDAPTVTVKSDDQLRKQKEKFALFGAFTDEQTKRTDSAFATIKRLSDALGGNQAAVDKATQTLTTIIAELNKTNRFRDFLAGSSLTATSTGSQMLEAIKNLSRDLNLRDRNEALIAEFQDTIIKLGQ